VLAEVALADELLKHACALTALACAKAWLKAAALPEACAWEYASAEESHSTRQAGMLSNASNWSVHSNYSLSHILRTTK
jgi:hypothetical protein